MNIFLTPQIAKTLAKILPNKLTLIEDGAGYAITEEDLTLMPDEISTFIARTTRLILSFEQIQWLSTETEGWLPALLWVRESINEEDSPLNERWNPEKITHLLREKSFSYFKKNLLGKIPPKGREALLTLALPPDITPEIFVPLFGQRSFQELMDWAVQNPLLLTQTSPTTWRFHRLFQDFLRCTAKENIPHYTELCLRIAHLYLDIHCPIEAEQLLSLFPLEGDPNTPPVFFSLGEAFAKSNKEKALTWFRRASLGFGHLGDSLGITRSLSAMGSLYLELGKKEEAEALYQQIKQEITPDELNQRFIQTYLSQYLPKLHLHCLGNFELYRGDERIDWNRWQRRKALSLLQYLALQPSHRATKEQLLELFWPEESPEKASNSYYVTIHTLRRALSAGLSEKIPYLEVERGSVYLVPASLASIDVEEFLRMSQEGRRLGSLNPTEAVKWFHSAKKLYRGNLLEENPYDEWLFPLREKLTHQYLDVLTYLALDYSHQEEADKALELWKEILGHDPTNEYATREAMLLLSRLERRTEALSIYRKLVHLLREELNTAPEPQTQELYETLLKNARWEDERAIKQ